MTAIDRLNKPKYASDEALSEHAQRHRRSSKRVRVSSAGGGEAVAPKQKVRVTAEEHPQLLAVAGFLALLAEPVSWLKLQDLLYYAQAWHLVWDGEQLFSEPIFASADGVLIEPLQTRFAGCFDLNARDLLLPASEPLPEHQQQTLSGIVQFYGQQNHFRLSEAIRQEQPWLAARARAAGSAAAEIRHEDLRSYFASLE